MARPVLDFLSVRRDVSQVDYRADIDGLRAIAILLVLGFHYFPYRVPGGFIGVDIFFVISGYLITGIILKHMARGDFTLRWFFGRRILRLFPALIAMLLGLAVFCWLYYTPDEFEALGKHIAGSAFYVSNFFLWSEAGYFDDSAITKPLLHMWSLAIEEQYYLFWPLFLVALAGVLPRALLPILLIAGVSFVLNLYFAPRDQSFAFYMPFTRGWELFVGATLAYWQQHPPDWWQAVKSRLPAILAQRAMQASPYLGLAMIGVALVIVDEKSVWPGWAALLPTIGTFLLICGKPESWLHRRFLSNPAMVWTGLISYPLYLWHWPLLSVAAVLGTEFPSRGTRRILLVLSIALAWATCKYVENPVRRNASPRTIASLLGIVTLIGVFGLFVWSQKGLPGRPGMVASEQEIAAYEATLKAFEFPFHAYPVEDCKTAYPSSGWCSAARDGVADVALIGDSHAHHFFPGLAKIFSEHGKNLVLLGSAGCPPLVDISSRQRDGEDWCKQGNDIIRHVADDQALGTVLLAANWHLYIVGKRFGDEEDEPAYWNINRLDAPGAESRLEAFEAQLRVTLDLLTGAGKKIYLLKQSPELDINLRRCVPRPRSFVPVLDCSLNLAEVQAYMDAYEKRLDVILADYKNVRVLDPVEHLCGSSGCPVLLDGKPIYRDRTHLSLFGSHYIAGKWRDEF